MVSVVLRRELRDVLRDRRTLFTMLVLPVLLYPALMLGFSQLTLSRVEKLRDRTYPVMVTVAGQALIRDGQLPPEKSLASYVLEVKQFAFTSVDDPAAAVKNGDLMLAVDLPGDLERRLEAGLEVKIVPLHRSADDEARTVLSAFEGAVRKFRRDRLPLIIDRGEGDQATPEQKGGHMFGGMLAMMVIMMAMTGSFYPALDVAAGEKERGTLETLLLSPASRLELVIGKYLTVLTVAVLAALMNLGSMAVTFAGFSNIVAKAGGSASFSISGAALVVILCGLLIMAGLFSAICLALSTFARTYKEGQAYLTPALLVVMPLAMVGLLPDMQIDEGLALIPVANMALLMKGLLVGEFPPTEIMLTMGSLLMFALVALLWTASLFSREEVLFREGNQLFGLRPPPGVPRPERPAPQVAILGVLLGLVWMVHAGGFVHGAGVAWTITVPLLGLAAVALALPRLSMVRLRSGLQLNPPPPMGWAAGVLLGAGGVGLTLGVAALQRLVLGEPDASALGPLPDLFAESLVVLILVAAVVPGIAEELLFRGLVLQGFRSAAKDRGAIIISAVLFGVFHLSIHRFFPQATLGLLLGVLAVQTRSIWPSVVAHAVHNGVLVSWAKIANDGERAEVEEPIMLYPVGVLVAVAALYIARRFRAEPPS
ncbi:MAG: hypothetical protein CMJ18_00975 [Phycisphaeraceae bacterium]|nr:hypothetical protein [Phycisphaeraceae bacterium]